MDPLEQIESHSITHINNNEEDSKPFNEDNNQFDINVSDLQSPERTEYNLQILNLEDRDTSRDIDEVNYQDIQRSNFDIVNLEGAESQIELSMEIKFCLLAIENQRLVKAYQDKNEECEFLASKLTEIVEKIPTSHQQDSKLNSFHSWKKLKDDSHGGEDTSMRMEPQSVLLKRESEGKVRPNTDNIEKFLLKMEIERLKKVAIEQLSQSKNQMIILESALESEEHIKKENIESSEKVNKLLNQLIQLQNRNQSQQDDMTIKEEEIKVFKIEIHNMRSVIEKFKMENQRLLNQKIDKKSALVPQSVENDLYEIRITSMEEKISELSKKVAQSNINCFKSRKQNKGLEVQIEEMKNFIAVYEKQIEELIKFKKINIDNHLDLLQKASKILLTKRQWKGKGLGDLDSRQDNSHLDLVIQEYCGSQSESNIGDGVEKERPRMVKMKKFDEDEKKSLSQIQRSYKDIEDRKRAQQFKKGDLDSPYFAGSSKNIRSLNDIKDINSLFTS